MNLTVASVNLPATPIVPAPAPAARPIYFGADERPLFGWLHLPATPRAPLGLIVSSPFGYEEICAHRALRHFANASASAGVAALRFDPDGCGDSAGDDRDPDRVRAWIAGVHHAADQLRRAAGVEAVCLLGVRLGALIAATAAADWPADGVALAGLIAIAPVVSGKAYLRELRALQMALGLGEPPPGAAVDADIQEAIGFAITAQTKADLGKIDLAKDDRPAPPAVLILDRDDLPTADAWAQRLAARGAAVESQRVAGYVEMVADPHKAAIPADMIERATAWLRQRAASLPASPAPRPLPTPRSEAHIAGVAERALFIDGDERIFGVLSTPATARPTGHGVLLLNAGSIHHVGPNRLYTALARRWAALGHTVLRVDLSGIGDSHPHPGEPENIVYSDRAVGDVAAALQFLRRQPGIVDTRAIGLCSGAYHAFKAAAAGHPVDGIVMINPLTYYWTPGQSLDFPAFRVADHAERYKRSVRDLDKWKKLLRGEVPVRNVVETTARHAASRLLARGRDLSRRLGLPWKGDAGAALQAIARRHVDIRFVFASGDPGLPLLHGEAGSAVPALRHKGKLAIEIIEGPDHTFTPLWSQAALTSVLGAAVDQRRR